MAYIKEMRNVPIAIVKIPLWRFTEQLGNGGASLVGSLLCQRNYRVLRENDKGGVMTVGAIGACFLVLIIGSLVAGFIDTWSEQRKRDKGKKGDY